MITGIASTPTLARQAYMAVSLRLPTEDIKVKQRLDRAYDIVTGYGYAITPHKHDTYLIAKASTSLLEDNSVRYVVNRNECSCPDYPTARANLCKHRMAILLLEEMTHE